MTGAEGFIMIRRVSRNKKKNIFSSKGGFSLVELVVVMGIMAVIMTLGFSGYTNSRRQTYMRSVATQFQSNMRTNFVDVLSTKTETQAPCEGQSTKIKVLRVKLGEVGGDEDLFTFYTACYVDSMLRWISTSASTSKNLTYKQSVFAKYTDKDGQVTSDYLYLAYTSPYGRFYSMKLAGDGLPGELSPWDTHNDDFSLAPPGGTPLEDVNLGNLELSFNSDSTGSGVEEIVKISSEGGIGIR